MVKIIPKQAPNGLWFACDKDTDSAYVKSQWFKDGYKDKRECEIDISNYLTFGCTFDFSDRMRG